MEEPTLENLQKELKDILEKIEQEEKDHKQKISDLEKDNETEEIAKVNAKREEILQKRVKTLEEKRETLFKVVEDESIIQGLIKKNKESKLADIDLLNILTNKDAKKIIEKQIKDQIIVFSEEGNTEKTKTEEQNCKLFLKEIYDFDQSQIARDYHKCMDQMVTQYSKHTLIDLIASSDLEVFIPMILKDKDQQKMMAYFIKSQFCQAVLTVQSTG